MTLYVEELSRILTEMLSHQAIVIEVEGKRYEVDHVESRETTIWAPGYEKAYGPSDVVLVAHISRS